MSAGPYLGLAGIFPNRLVIGSRSRSARFIDNTRPLDPGPGSWCFKVPIPATGVAAAVQSEAVRDRDRGNVLPVQYYSLADHWFWAGKDDDISVYATVCPFGEELAYEGVCLIFGAVFA